MANGNYDHSRRDGEPGWDLVLVEVRRALLSCFPDRAEVLMEAIERAAVGCPDCSGKGWDIFNAGPDRSGEVGEIQRCDSCCRLANDDVACRVVLAFSRRTVRVATRQRRRTAGRRPQAASRT